MSASGFEGPEKKLEICFFDKPSDPLGLRVVSQADWQSVLNLVKCTILSCTKNAHFDAYVLSESSLFVYPYKVILKTCGTTTLLCCVKALLDLVDHLDTGVEFVSFSRKNLIFPEAQLYPHLDFDQEVKYLNKYFKIGHGYVLGPKDGDHWYLYIADFDDGPTQGGYVPDQTFEILMTNLDPDAMRVFYQDSPDYVSAKHTTAVTGIADLIPGATTDEFQFDPCGYSVNGLLDDVYFTIHVTPEPECSFVSFETNLSLRNFAPLINHVVSIFRPGTLAINLFADCDSPSAATKNAIGTTPELLSAYSLLNRTTFDFDGYEVTLVNLEKRDAPLVNSGGIVSGPLAIGEIVECGPEILPSARYSRSSPSLLDVEFPAGVRQNLSRSNSRSIPSLSAIAAAGSAASPPAASSYGLPPPIFSSLDAFVTNRKVGAIRQKPKTENSEPCQLVNVVPVAVVV
eukprot:TRINITY_DN17016_c1_g1_i1.p1 TRINITY_DN17016_c1_g1~~TRINITY_DN17016_c1_g1_i1.p1  ORF type:complete len:457 (+),score=120.71 TRINITY_DN17016_c1_g1_i1:542-1912(+)